jgi:transcriptional regulator with PAS, ATPase and Fis domain
MTTTPMLSYETPPAAPLRPCLFVVMSAAFPHGPSSRHDLAQLKQVLIGRGDGGVRRDNQVVQLAISDGNLSSQHATIHHHDGAWIVEDVGSKNGTWVGDSRVAPRQQVVLRDGDIIQLASTLLIFRAAVAVEADPDVSSTQLTRPAELRTLVPSLEATYRRLERVAASDLPILLYGETGTGKEVVAHAVHGMSPRASRPMVVVNCGAIPKTLAESTLFGHRRGAFSGATEDRPGFFRAADHSTIFLDEIGDLDPPVQAMILRVLQQKEIVPVGSTSPIRVDVRVVCASHFHLPSLVDQGRFRQDLLHRLGGSYSELPALRQRREDLGILVSNLLRKNSPELADQVTFTVNAARTILTHDWPGNIRQLEHALWNAVATNEPGVPISSKALEEHQVAASTPPMTVPVEMIDPATMTDAARKVWLEAELRANRGNVHAIARRWDKTRVTIRRWCKRYDLDPDRFRTE